MFLIVLVAVLVLGTVELWATVAVAEAIGVLPTLLALVALSVVGVWLSARQGVSVWRSATAELAAGRTPTRQLLDGALVLVGGIALMVPGFVTGAAGALLLLPPVRALVRPLLLAWLGARAARLARSGRMRTVVVGTTVGPDGTVRRRTVVDGTVVDPDVIDSDGWEVDDRGELPGPGDRGGRDPAE